ncbi:hypothetical protein R3W88_019504 [Solanum pinnatisectum]|uniref:Retrotransposon gag domain-containing protein n=1 Tax=Solanum pinnatisectum TaxID=50273 RepID=A0AAV9KKH2_9SOLN|nr:hypothetical protein R3W88_019504 [Solanum pinnatisectum]
MAVIGLRVFPLSLTSDATVWFFELPYNSIHTWDQLHEVFMVKYFPLSKKLNHKDKLNNFLALHGESVISSWDRFTAFIRSVSNHCIDDKSLKEYFYRDGGFPSQRPRFQLGSLVPRARKPSSMSQIEDMMQKMMKRLDLTDENVKEMRNDLSGIGQKVDAHVVSIKQLEQQMNQLSTTAIDPPMPSEVEIEVSKDDDEIEVTGESKKATKKEVEITQKVVPMPRPPPPFPQRLVKKNEEGKYHRFITMLK